MTGSTTTVQSTAFDFLDGAHAGAMAFIEQGRAQGQREASEWLARQWLHDLANDFEALAISNAAAKGPHWQAAMIEAARGGVA
ncbi:hypothetical protein [Pedococcus cremeus]|uniref:hypothetical protein n=1 Tax=Pedococcus cremeus TaxID=587636 RepID=UPI000B85F448|nr:hypothetical protein [Pedococcus cremeus]